MDFDKLNNASPFLFTASAVLAGFLLIDDMTANEQNAISGWFLLLGQILQTNAAQQLLLQARATGGAPNLNDKNVKEIYNPLFYDIGKLKEVLKNVTPTEQDYTINLLKRTMRNLQNQVNDIEKELNK